MKHNQIRAFGVRERHARQLVEAQKRLEKLEKQACSFKVGQVIDGYGEIVKIKCVKRKGRKKGQRDYKVSFRGGRSRMASRLIKELSNDKPALIMGGYDLTKGLHGQACDDLIAAYRYVQRYQAKFLKIIRLNGKLDEYKGWLRCKHHLRPRKELMQGARQFLDMSKLTQQERRDYDKFIQAQMSLNMRLSAVTADARRGMHGKVFKKSFHAYEQECIRFIKEHNDKPSSLPSSDMGKVPRLRGYMAYYAFCLSTIFQHKSLALQLGKPFRLPEEHGVWLFDRSALISSDTHLSHLTLPKHSTDLIFKGSAFPEGGYSALIIAPLSDLERIFDDFSRTEFAKEFRFNIDSLTVRERAPNKRLLPPKHIVDGRFYYKIAPLYDAHSKESIPNTGLHMTDKMGRFVCMMRISYAQDLAEKYVMKPFRREQDLKKKKSLATGLGKAIKEMEAMQKTVDDGAQNADLICRFVGMVKGFNEIVQASNLLPQDIAKTVANMALCYHKIFILQKLSNGKESQRYLKSAIKTQRKGLDMASKCESILSTRICKKWQDRLDSWDKTLTGLAD